MNHFTNIAIKIEILILIGVAFFVIKHVKSSWTKPDEDLRSLLNPIHSNPHSEVGPTIQKNLREYDLMKMQLNFTRRLAQIKGPIPLVPISILLFVTWLFLDKKPCISSNRVRHISSRSLNSPRKINK